MECCLICFIACCPCFEGKRRRVFALCNLFSLTSFTIIVLAIISIFHKDVQYGFGLSTTETYVNASYQFLLAVSIITLILIIGGGLLGNIWWLVDGYKLIVKIALQISFWTDCAAIVGCLSFDIASIYKAVSCYNVGYRSTGSSSGSEIYSKKDNVSSLINCSTTYGWALIMIYLYSIYFILLLFYFFPILCLLFGNNEENNPEEFKKIAVTPVLSTSDGKIYPVMVIKGQQYAGGQIIMPDQISSQTNNQAIAYISPSQVNYNQPLNYNQQLPNQNIQYSPSQFQQKNVV